MALTNPTPAQLQDIFDFKRTIIQGLVTRIEVHQDKTVTVNLELDNKPDESDEVLSISDIAFQPIELEIGSRIPRHPQSL